MTTAREAVFIKDAQNRKITVTRSFDATLEQVWNAWTRSEILDQWWAPKPYRAETRTMDFREGGFWLYAMVGPEGDRSWCRESFKTIVFQKSITNDTGFCDEAGNENKDFPIMHWTKGFSTSGTESQVNIEILFDSLTDMETIIGMGFEEGFKMGLGNLEAYFSK